MRVLKGLLRRAQIHSCVEEELRSHIEHPAVLLTLLTALLSGAAPVRQVLRTDPNDIIKAVSKIAGGRRSCSATGTMLSITGMFGIAPYSVSRRMKELGIRMALGAKRKEVPQAALGRAFRLPGIRFGGGIDFGSSG